jgi:CO/xanthine dehydrogenase Mo-binding subunit
MAGRLSGGTRFIDDIAVPGLALALVLRADSPRGRIKSLRLPDLPPGYAVVTAADIGGTNRLSALDASLPLLADTEVRYSGEPVAIIAGPDPVVLQKLLAFSWVEIEEAVPALDFENYMNDQVARRRSLSLGDPKTAFTQASSVIEGTYRTGPQAHCYSEPQGAIAVPGSGGMIVHSSTQWPYHVRDTVASALGIDAKLVVVKTADIGMHMDGKLWYPSLVAAHAALAAAKLGKPVKLLLTREEDFRFTPKRAPSVIRHRTALDQNGDILAAEVKILVNVGAYGPLASEILDRMCIGAMGACACPNLTVEALAVTTNIPPLDAFNGMGLSQAFFAAESQASRIAGFARRNPTEWKLRNLLSKNAILATGGSMKEDVPAEKILQQIASASDFDRKYAAYELLKNTRKDFSDGPLRGIGVAFCYQGNGFSGSGEERENYSVELTLDKDSKLSIRTSANSGSAMTVRIWKELAGSILSVPVDQISLEPVSTDLVPNSGPSTLSRNIVVITRLIERCCHAIQKQRFRDPLPITVKRVNKLPSALHWNAARLSGDPFAQYSWAGAVVEVEIDAVTMESRVRHVWLCVDGGRILSRDRARQMLEAGCVHAVGWASREFVSFVDGKIPRDLFYRYHELALDEAPPVSVEFVENDKDQIKGLGDLPYNCVPAAYCAAVSQATGGSFEHIPLPEDALPIHMEEE